MREAFHLNVEVFHTRACRTLLEEAGLSDGWCFGAGCYAIANGKPVQQL